jgi:hypothetical protein
MMKRPSKVPLPKVPLPQKKTVVIKPKTEAAKGDVSSISEIFVAFFRLCKRRLLPVLAVLVLATVVSLLLLAALGFGGLTALGVDMQQAQQFITGGDLQKLFINPQLIVENPLLLGGGAIMLLAVMLLWSWCYTVMLAAAVDEHHGILESLCTGWKYLFPMLWVNMLLIGIYISWATLVAILIPSVLTVLSPLMPAFNFQNIDLLAGSVVFIAFGVVIALLFFLLSISIPFSMIFCFMVMIDEGIVGIDALLISRLYMRGHWWNTFFKMFLIGLVWVVLTLPFSFLPLFMPFIGHKIAVNLVALLIAPLMLLYMVAVYRDLKQANGKVDPRSAYRCLWMPMALAGILLPLLAMIGAAVVGGPKQFDQLLNKAGLSTRPIAEQNNPPVPVSEEKPEVRILPSVDGFIIWRDPTGDTGNPLLDIREVSAVGEKGELLLTVTLAKPFAEYFAPATQDDYAQLVSFYFDADMDSATGVVLTGEEGRTGYDLELDVLLAVSPAGAGRAYPSLYAVGPKKRQSLAPLADSTAIIADSTLTIRLPYDRIDGVVGGKLKVCFREVSQREGGGLSKDQAVPLK